MDGRFELGTSRVELAIREVATGRKNFVLTAPPEGRASRDCVHRDRVCTPSAARPEPSGWRPYLVDVISRSRTAIPSADLHALLPVEGAERQAPKQAARQGGSNTAGSDDAKAGA